MRLTGGFVLPYFLPAVSLLTLNNNRNSDSLSEMHRKVIRRRQEIAKEAVDGRSFKRFHFSGKKIVMKFTAQMAPSGPIW
jgi:hypothetical protein